MRDAYDGSEFRSMISDEKTDRIFERLDNEALLTPIIPGKYDYTYEDVILGQIRHIMYHVGHCNSILRHHNIPAVEWIAHNEKRQ